MFNSDTRDMGCAAVAGRGSLVHRHSGRGGVVADPVSAESAASQSAASRREAVNPVAQSIDGATGDWSMSGDAMRWSPDLAEKGPAAGELRGIDVGAGFGSGLGLDMNGVRRLVSGALKSLGTVARDVVTELRQLTRGSGTDDALDRCPPFPYRRSARRPLLTPPRRAGSRPVPVEPTGAGPHLGSRMSNALTMAPAPRSEAAEQVRAEVREFLAAELAAGTFRTHVDTWLSGVDPAFSKKLGERGWLGMTWPKKYGGHGRSAVEHYAVTAGLVAVGGPVRSAMERYADTEELLPAVARVAAHGIADRQSGPNLLRYGTEEQRQAI